MFMRKRHVSAGSVVMLGQTTAELIRVANVQPALRILKDVDPEVVDGCVVQAPRVGFEPTTRRLIPARRDSTVEQIVSDPAGRSHTLDLLFPSHGRSSIWM